MNRLISALLCAWISLYAAVAGAQSVPGGSVYDKPYLGTLGGRAAIGGYFDIEYVDDGDGSTFDQHRFIPFIYSKISDDIRFAVEIEFEHGGNPSKEGEVKLEYSALDIEIADWLVLRSGLLLSPLGRFNIYHDSPLNDLTNRPLLARGLIPTTLSESGMGFHGEIFTRGESIFGYELYIVNGFNESLLALDADTLWEVRIRNGRGSAKSDNNDDKSLVGRFSWSPSLGIDLAFSMHRGKYDDANSKGLSITAFDYAIRRGRFEVLGETAWASIELPAGGLVTDDRRQSGHYLQGNVHLLQDLIDKWPMSTLTISARYGFIDYDRDSEGNEQERITLGFNFRPVEETVIKLDYELDWDIGFGQVERGNSKATYLLSIASYF